MKKKKINLNNQIYYQLIHLLDISSPKDNLSLMRFNHAENHATIQYIHCSVIEQDYKWKS